MRFKKLLLCLFIVFFLSCLTNSGQGDNLSFYGFYSLPNQIIKKFNNQDVNFQEHFLIGLSYKKIGNKKSAIFHFANSCFKYSENLILKLYPYPIYKYLNEFHIKSEYYEDAVYEIAKLFYNYREFKYVVKFINLLEKSHSVLFKEAIILKAKSLAELNKYDAGITVLTDLLSAYTDINSRSDILIRIASIYEKKEDLNSAVLEYFKIIELNQSAWQAGVASNRIADIILKTKHNFNEKDNYLLALALSFTSKKNLAVKIFKQLLISARDSEIHVNVSRNLVKLYIKTGKHKEADAIIKKFLENSTAYYGLLKIKADEAWKKGKRKMAIYTYKTICKNYSNKKSKFAQKRIAIYNLNNKLPGYNKLLKKYIEKYPNDTASEYFIWIMVKDFLKKKEYKSCVNSLEKAVSLFPEGEYSARNRFWLVKLYSKLNRENDALKISKDLVFYNPNSAYTWKILEKIKGNFSEESLAQAFNKAVEIESKEALFYHFLLLFTKEHFLNKEKRIEKLDYIELVNKYRDFAERLEELDLKTKHKNNLKDIEKYFKIGYADGISREMNLIPRDEEIQKEKYSALAYFGQKYNNYYFAMISTLKLLKLNNLKENISILSSRAISNLFPAAFDKYISKECHKRKIEKEMVFAVMKAESSFNHRAVSPSGAVGLMQIMPRTARGIARELGVKKFDLKDPSISLSFGIKYLSWLKKMFKGQFDNMLAGYNAGATNVKRWRNKIKSSDNDFFIEFIPFNETKYYVLRTKRFLIQYRIIYNAGNISNH